MNSPEKNLIKFKNTLATVRRQRDRQVSQDYYLEQLNFEHNGYPWTADVALIAYLRTATTDTVVILDNYNRPRQVDVKSLLTVAQQIHDSVMAEWLAQDSV